MADTKTKKSSSFRKIFPFFNKKSKEKHNDISHTSKSMASNHQASNQYFNPQFIRKCNKEKGTEQNEIIYENLSIPHSLAQTYIDHQGAELQDYIKMCSHTNMSYNQQQKLINYPQESIVQNNHDVNSNGGYSQYPDTYYHSIDRLVSNLSPEEEKEISKASQVQANPQSVGAEIKRVSNKFLISPKTEASIRTIQPTRARSLSLNKHKHKNQSDLKSMYCENYDVDKPYHYSAPTSPVSVGHRIPNMPLTVSPYESLKKKILEAEQGRKYLSRSSMQSKTSQSVPLRREASITPTSPTEINNVIKDAARLKVEAFYWKKIKEMKVQEDEYILNKTHNSFPPLPNVNTYSVSNCSSPSSFMLDSRSYSLPQDLRRRYNVNLLKNNYSYQKSTFARSIHQRTDNFVTNIKNSTESEKDFNHYSQHRTSPSLTLGNELYSSEMKHDAKSVVQQCANFENSNQSLTSGGRSSQTDKRPPQPPIRTTSVGNSTSRWTQNIIQAGGSNTLYYGSESGSEAGEIRRMFQKEVNKGK